jgi:hypothetical protein
MSNELVDSGARAAMAGDARHRTHKIVIGFAAAMLALATPLVHCQPQDDSLKTVPIDELKSVYLSCNRAAISGRLDTAAIMQCSVVYEELKRRAFEGDFDKLIAWSRSQPPALNTAR